HHGRARTPAQLLKALERVGKRLLWPRQHRYYPDPASGAQCLLDLGHARLRIDKLALKDRAHVTAEPVSSM
ncbi:hypothetical protein, partial [Escherichia coli]|uniref:hypothetical protein n=1 Tax=Escherichia coli TaxID=562 RepID=UPI001953439E